MQKCICPQCNSNLVYDENDREFIFCQYCGTKILLDDYRTSHRIIDEARIKEAETNRMVKLRQLELYEKDEKKTDIFQTVLKWLWLAITVILFVILIIMIVKPNSDPDYPVVVLMYFLWIMVPVVCGGAIFIFGYLSSQKKEKLCRREFDYLVLKYPDLAPKTFSNYQKMKKSRSVKYREMLAQLEERGVDIELFFKD